MAAKPKTDPEPISRSTPRSYPGRCPHQADWTQLYVRNWTTSLHNPPVKLASTKRLRVPASAPRRRCAGGSRARRLGQGGWLIPFAYADMGEIVESGFARDRAQLNGEHLAPGKFHGAYQNK
jgi:hypothetical protein